MLPALLCFVRVIYAVAVQGAIMFAQAENVPASKFDPDVKSIVKLRVLLAFLGLIILFIGTFLILWLIGRHFKRTYLGEPKPPNDSPFAEFGYQRPSQRKPQDADDAQL